MIRIVFSSALLLAGALSAHAEMLMRSPSGERYPALNPNGESVLPNGRLITPSGPMIRVRPHPFGLTLSHDGRFVITLSSDGAQLTIVDLADSANPKVTFFPENYSNEKDGVLDAAFMGLAVSPDDKLVYVGGGSDYSVLAITLEDPKQVARIACDHDADGKSFVHGYLGDLRLSRDGKTLYAVDQSNFRMLVIDVEGQKVLRSIETGRYPFGIALSPDEREAYIANVGIFEYSFVRDNMERIAKLHFPPFGYGSKEMEEGTEIEDLKVPGLGSATDISGTSVWTVDISERGAEHVTAKVKSGHLVGESLEDFPAVGGSSPNSIAVTEDYIYASNGSNDSITVLDRKSGRRHHDIDLYLDSNTRKLRGNIPFGLALDPDGEYLYVAEAGINAVAVIRLSDHEFVGRIPTAWFPSKLAVSPDGKRLFVACAKGIGSGPSGGPNHAAGDPTGIGDLMRGYLNIITLPAQEADYAALTARVVQNNVDLYSRKDDPRKPGHPVPVSRKAWKSPIKHVIYVTKENRTYDEIFGANPKGKGFPDLCRLGKKIDVTNKDGSRTVKDVLLMPNHVALGDRFAFSDNFYCDSDHSSDGHRWLVGTYPNEFMEARQGESAVGIAPGNFLFTGSSGAIYPEDYNEAGSIWEHFERSKVRFFNFGLGFEFAPGDEEQEYTDTGIRLPINYPMPKPLFENTSRNYATYNTSIPDQFRMDMFTEDYKEKWLSGKEPFPGVITMMLPNDHGSGERPEDGYPFWASYMSDNDLALGRLVELISHSPWWKETVIFVTEDDAQGHRDSVDAHRSICMAIGPHVKPGFVSHKHISMGSILKTMFLIQGMGPLNQYDGCATDLADFFLDEADNSAPYQALPVNAEIFDPQKAFDPFDREFKWESLGDSPPLDGPQFLDNDPYGHAGGDGLGPRP